MMTDNQDLPVTTRQCNERHDENMRMIKAASMRNWISIGILLCLVGVSIDAMNRSQSAAEKAVEVKVRLEAAAESQKEYRENVLVTLTSIQLEQRDVRKLLNDILSRK
jgi:hypothetical protein